MNAVIPVLYGESCLLSDRPELIAPLADKVRLLHGRQSKIIASHLDALKAFSEDDEARLRAAMIESGSSIETPLAMLMSLQLAVSNDSPKEILHLMGRLLKEEPFLDFPQRVRTVVLNYLIKKADTDILSTPDELYVCAEIAAMLETPGDDVSFLRRIILLDQFKRNLLKEEDLLNALKKYSGDPVLLRIAAEYYLLHRQPARAMDYIAEYNSLPDVGKSSSMAVMHILALDFLGRKDEAEKEFRSIVEQSDDNGFLLYLYFEFCVENNYAEPLRSLAAWLESLPKDSANRAVLPFVRAEILLAEGKRDQALDLFEKTASDDPRFVFHAASRLAEAGRDDAALKRYLSIRKTYSELALVDASLSALYSKMGDAKNAFESARAAWQEDPESLQMRYLYGTHLFEAGQYADVISVLKFPQYKASFPEEVLELWSKAIRKQIKIDYDAVRYDLAMENAKSLQIYFPDDAEAKDYISKVELIRRQERRGEK